MDSFLRYVLIALLLVFTSQCQTAPVSTDSRADPPSSIHFNEATAVVVLGSELRELSGLTLLDSAHLGAVHDEEGLLYRIALSDGSVVSTTRFHGDGDFEGIEVAGDAIWALQSDGDLFHIDTDENDAEKYETPLTSSFDTEGLAFDPTNQRLLIACKEYPGDGLDGFRAVYAFDLGTRTLAPTPVLLLDIRTDTRLRTFKPSALALHPPTGWWLILSSTTQQIAALDSESQLVRLWQLPESLLPQPEALAVLPDGDVLVGSEGRPARIARFRYAPTERN